MQMTFEDYAERERQRLLQQRDALQRKLLSKERTHADNQAFTEVQNNVDRIGDFLRQMNPAAKG